MNQVTDMWNNMGMVTKVAVGVLLLVVVWYIYSRYQLSQAEAEAHEMRMMMMPPPENFGPGSVGQTSGEASGDIVCTMYYVDWCPHCKTAKPEWEKLMQSFNGKVVNGKKVLVVKVNCEENPDAAKQAGVDGFPTFKFNLNGKDFDYDDERVYDRFEAFVHYLAQM